MIEASRVAGPTGALVAEFCAVDRVRPAEKPNSGILRIEAASQAKIMPTKAIPIDEAADSLFLSGLYPTPIDGYFAKG